MATKNTIDDASHQEWSEAGQTLADQQRRDWYAKSAKIEGDACVGAGLPSGIAPCEPQAPSARSLWPDGSLPVVEAEALSQEWLGRSLKCAAASRKDSAEGRDTHAWCNEVRSATYLLCADELRQRAGLPTSRQPEENAVVSHTGALPDSKISNQVPSPGVGL